MEAILIYRGRRESWLQHVGNKVTTEGYQILLTNDDGIDSPGLWAAATSLSELGYVHVVAPRDQSSGSGRSMPTHTDGTIRPQEIKVKDQPWTVYAVGGSPAQAVSHGILEIMPRQPDLVVAGINYGQNLGTGITISGTVGAALEAAAFGVPALAVSVETEDHYHLTYSADIDFSAAAYFTALMARWLLERRMPPDVDILKVDIPSEATRETSWTVTRLARRRYYESILPERKSWEEPGRIGYRQTGHLDGFSKDSDVYAIAILRQVSVTPLSLDLTSRLDLKAFERELRGQ